MAPRTSSARRSNRSHAHNWYWRRRHSSIMAATDSRPTASWVASTIRCTSSVPITLTSSNCMRFRPKHTRTHVMSSSPALLKEKDKGKFRYLRITETPPADPDHRMLRSALEDDHDISDV